MRILVAGASGVLGQATIWQLCHRGHQVVGLVRSQEKAAEVHELGAEPAIGDVLDLESLRGAVSGCDVVVNAATAIPKKNRPSQADWQLNDRVRREGTHNLLQASRELNLHAFIQQSVAFLYGDRQNEWLTEDEPPRPSPVLQSAIDAEKMVLGAFEGYRLPVVILRGATFYAADAWHTRSMLNSIKHRTFAVIGTGEQYWHYIYVDDMAEAIACAVENPIPGETFFVADDWPFHSRDLIDFLTVQLNVARAPQLPYLAARAIGGRSAGMLAQSARFKTDKIKKMMGWAPRHPTYRDGFAEILPLLGVRPH